MKSLFDFREHFFTVQDLKDMDFKIESFGYDSHLSASFIRGGLAIYSFNKKVLNGVITWKVLEELKKELICTIKI